MESKIRQINFMCPICGARLYKGIYAWHSLCQSCGYEAGNLACDIESREKKINLDEGYRESGLKDLRVSNFKYIISILSKYLNKNTSILDVGCAHGWFVEIASQKYNTLGIEPDAYIYRMVQARGLNIRHGYFPECLLDEEVFDCIVFNDVFEHIPNSAEVLKECKKHLSSGGVLLLNVPSSEGFFYRTSKIAKIIGMGSFFERMWQFGLPSPHLHYFTTLNLSNLLISNGFRIIENGRIDSITSEGLYNRIRCAGKVGRTKSLIIYLFTLLIIPLIKILPSDAVYIVAANNDKK